MNNTSPRATLSAAIVGRIKALGLLAGLALLPAAAMASMPASETVYAYPGDPAEGARAVLLIQADDGSLHPATAIAAEVAAATGTPPAAPATLTITVNSQATEATLNWSAVDGASSYNVYEGSTAGGESATPILSGVTGTSVTISGINNKTSYYFTVAAVNAFGVSGPSPEASIVPEHAGGAFAPPLLGLLLGAAALRRRKAGA